MTAKTAAMASASRLARATQGWEFRTPREDCTAPHDALAEPGAVGFGAVAPAAVDEGAKAVEHVIGQVVDEFVISWMRR